MGQPVRKISPNGKRLYEIQYDTDMGDGPYHVYDLEMEPPEHVGARESVDAAVALAALDEVQQRRNSPQPPLGTPSGVAKPGRRAGSKH